MRDSIFFYFKSRNPFDNLASYNILKNVINSRSRAGHQTSLPKSILSSQ